MRDCILREGDEVMFIKKEETGKDKVARWVNGDVGVVETTTRDKGKGKQKACDEYYIALRKDGTNEIVNVHCDNLKTYVSLRYAVNVYKMQGSEADHVLVMLDRSRQNRSLFYTAVTRGKKTVGVFATKAKMDKARRTPVYRECSFLERKRGDRKMEDCDE